MALCLMEHVKALTLVTAVHCKWVQNYIMHCLVTGCCQLVQTQKVLKNIIFCPIVIIFCGQNQKKARFKDFFRYRPVPMHLIFKITRGLLMVKKQYKSNLQGQKRGARSQKTSNDKYKDCKGTCVFVVSYKDS